MVIGTYLTKTVGIIDVSEGQDSFFVKLHRLNFHSAKLTSISCECSRGVEYWINSFSYSLNFSFKQAM